MATICDQQLTLYLEFTGRVEAGVPYKSTAAEFKGETAVGGCHPKEV